MSVDRTIGGWMFDLGQSVVNTQRPAAEQIPMGVATHSSKRRSLASPLRGGRVAGLAWQSAVVSLSLKLLFAALVGGVTFQLDFNGDLYLAGLRILHGISPYEPGLLQHQAAIVQAGGALVTQTFPRYPAPMLLAAVPFGLLPMAVADVVFVILCLAAVIGGLWLLGVRDWRCIPVTLVACPVYAGVLLGNLSPLLLLGAAVIWRWRDRMLPPAAAFAAVIVGKLFLWPIGVWMLAARRGRALGLGVALAIVGLLAAWAAIDFAGFTEYPRMLMDIAEIGGGRGCSLVALLTSIGIQPPYARLVALTAALSLLVVACRLMRLPGGDRNAFGLTVIAALTACPVVWSHYLVLLYVPIALLSPRLSPIWFLPMLSVFAPAVAANGYGVAMLPILVGELVLAAFLCRPLLAVLPARYARVSVAMARAAAPS
jgi:hypothetical protein